MPEPKNQSVEEVARECATEIDKYLFNKLGINCCDGGMRFVPLIQQAINTALSTQSATIEKLEERIEDAGIKRREMQASLNANAALLFAASEELDSAGVEKKRDGELISVPNRVKLLKATIADQQKRIAELEGKCAVKDALLRDIKTDCYSHFEGDECCRCEAIDKALSSPGQEVVRVDRDALLDKAWEVAYQVYSSPKEASIRLMVLAHNFLTSLPPHLTPNRQEKRK